MAAARDGRAAACSFVHFNDVIVDEVQTVGYSGDMQRVVIIGRGASGKSTLAIELGEITGLPVIELDKMFWQPGLVAPSRDQWMAIQQELVERESWIMDGDLGPYDVLDVRLRAADTVIFLDFSLVRCAWRAIRRSPERADFWRWLFAYRRRSRPLLLKAVAAHAAKADFHVFRSPGALERFVRTLIAEPLPVRAGRSSP